MHRAEAQDDRGRSAARAVEQFLQPERFYEVDGRLGVEAGLEVAFLSVGAYQDDRRATDRLAFADAADDLEPAEAGHVDVEDEEARLEPAREAERLLAVGRDGHSVTEMAEDRGDDPPDCVVVVSDENERRHGLANRARS